MKKLNFLSLIFAVSILTFTFSTVKAQDEPQGDAPTKPQFDGQQRRPNLLQELGLTQEQRQQIRRLNAEKQPMMREAQMRLREANRNLDQAIYADNVSETEVQARMREAQLAHAEVIRIRSLTELAVRKVLTPEQLAKFREVRSRFADRMENRKNQLKDRIKDSPNRPKNNRQNLRPNN